MGEGLGPRAPVAVRRLRLPTPASRRRSALTEGSGPPPLAYTGVPRVRRRWRENGRLHSCGPPGCGGKPMYRDHALRRRAGRRYIPTTMRTTSPSTMTAQTRAGADVRARRRVDLRPVRRRVRSPGMAGASLRSGLAGRKGRKGTAEVPEEPKKPNTCVSSSTGFRRGPRKPGGTMQNSVRRRARQRFAPKPHGDPAPSPSCCPRGRFVS